MKFPYKAFILLNLTLLLIPACTTQIPDTPSPTIYSSGTQGSIQPATKTPSPEKIIPTLSDISPEPTQTAPLLPITPQVNPSQHTQYLLSAVLDYGQHRLSVDEQIIYFNHVSEPLSEFIFIIEPTLFPSVFHLKGLNWEDGSPITDYDLEVGWLRLPLPETLFPGGRLAISLTYDLNLPSPDASYYGRPIPFGYTSRQTNLVDWYPYLPPYQPGQGWLVHQAGFFGEHLVYETADFQVNIRMDDQREDLILAASAPTQMDGDWRHYQLKSARNFVWSVSPLYQVEQIQVGNVTLLGYEFPAHAAAGASAIKTTAEALSLYSRLFGPYPHETLSLVEADFLDGLEYDGLYFLSNGFYNLYNSSPSDYLTAIAAHETAHQWWYGLVGNDQALEPWLDEALCTYMERIYYEYTHPESLDWWWTYRVNYYQPHGWVDGSIYNPEGYRAYRDAVYLNGAIFLEDLRNLMGDEAFFASLKDYLTRYSHKIATTVDFFRVVKDHTSIDLNPLMKTFFSQK
jgi:hypothetical protein